MTTVTFYRKNGIYKGFICFGHADYAKKHFFHKEPDILCSAISTLVFHTINSLQELAGEKLAIDTQEETGFVKCDFVSELQEKSIFLVDSFIFSLENIAREYGEQYLQVKFEEV